MKSLPIFFFLFYLLSASSSEALVMSPMRVIFTGTQRSAEVVLNNNSTTPATYRVSLVNKRMKRDSSYEDVTSAISLTGERFADKMLKFSPKLVTLKPGETQMVRVLLRKPGNLATGEYRSYLQMKQIPTEQALKPQPKTKKKPLDIQLRAVYGFSIPIIVRHGKTSASVEIKTAKFVRDPQESDRGSLFLTLVRSGNQSVYGPLRVTFKPLKETDEIQVGIVNNMAVPVPNVERDYELKLKFPPKRRSLAGSLKIVYSDGESGSDGPVLAEKVIEIP